MSDIKMIIRDRDLELYEDVSKIDLEKATGPIQETAKYLYTESAEEQRYYGIRPTVFISHKHDDLPRLKKFLGLLQYTYGVSVYIDSKDPSMPSITSAVTAKNIKHKIRDCNRFILLATDRAVESKWCNWELGFGDARKYIKSISIFPLIDNYESASDYKGSEYMGIYPHIAYSPSFGYNKYLNCKDDYCVVIETDRGQQQVALYDWLWHDWQQNV